MPLSCLAFSLVWYNVIQSGLEDRRLFSSCPCVLSRFVSVLFHCMPWFFSGKGWQLTCMQHTRRLTHVQYTKYITRVLLTIVQHMKMDSRAAHDIELGCSTRKITLMSHASLVRVTRQKYKNTRVLAHTSVNLEMSCIVHTILHCRLGSDWWTKFCF